MFVTMASMANEPNISLTPANEVKSLVLELGPQSKESKIEQIDENAKTIYSERSCPFRNGG